MIASYIHLIIWAYVLQYLVCDPQLLRKKIGQETVNMLRAILIIAFVIWSMFHDYSNTLVVSTVVASLVALVSRPLTARFSARVKKYFATGAILSVGILLCFALVLPALIVMLAIDKETVFDQAFVTRKSRAVIVAVFSWAVSYMMIFRTMGSLPLLAGLIIICVTAESAMIGVRIEKRFETLRPKRRLSTARVYTNGGH